jgi:hypothetical protein
MNQSSNERVDDLLRQSAASARRAPPAELRASVAARIESRASRARVGVDNAPLVHERSSAWRSRVQDVLAAAAVVIAIGVWGFAFLRPLPSGAPPPSVADNARPAPGDALAIAVGEPAAAPLLAAARATPGTLRAAIDDSLFAELGNIAHDATRAARFLVGRVPAPLVTRAPEDAAH